MVERSVTKLLYVLRPNQDQPPVLWVRRPPEHAEAQLQDLTQQGMPSPQGMAFWDRAPAAPEPPLRSTLEISVRPVDDVYHRALREWSYVCHTLDLTHAMRQAIMESWLQTWDAPLLTYLSLARHARATIHLASREPIPHLPSHLRAGDPDSSFPIRALELLFVEVADGVESVVNTTYLEHGKTPLRRPST